MGLKKNHLFAYILGGPKYFNKMGDGSIKEVPSNKTKNILGASFIQLVEITNRYI